MGEASGWMSRLQKLREKYASAQTQLEGHVAPVTDEEETKETSPAYHQIQETPLMMTSDENKQHIKQNNVSTAVEQQKPEAVVNDNPNNTSVSVLSPQNQEFLPK